MFEKFPQKRWIRFISGSLVLLSLALGLFISKWWFLLNFFVGFNLLQSSFTDFCPAEIFLRKLNIPE
ncbi:MAG: DUF2892 domain-containing protein [Candidatus Omnitrophica bacterium]|nr:DUF2892 domain-containing protein [Candidatus Omnitrophota bacterium]MBD3269126.1 DUF2892 domain-containing protein [Candidatus Omnitrophota bacterium]